MFANRASTKEAIENDAAQTENTGDDIDAEVAAANARKKLQTTASLKPSEWTLISLPSHRRDTSFVVRETIGHTKRA